RQRGSEEARSASEGPKSLAGASGFHNPALSCYYSAVRGRSHSRTVLSALPVRARFPSAEKARVVMAPLWPTSRASSRPGPTAPPPQRPVPAAGQDTLAVGREGDAAHRAGVPREGPDHLARLDVEQVQDLGQVRRPDRPLGRDLLLADQEGGPVGREGQAV